MDDLVVRRPVTALRLVNELVLPGAQVGDTLELSVRAESHALPARDMAAYLELIDHIYGRLRPEGFRSYAMRPYAHVRLAEVRSGSLEMAVVETLVQGAAPLVILWLCLRFLPQLAVSVTSAYNNYQQGALARENRKRIRREMERDETMAELPKERRAEIAALIESLCERDAALLPRASRFAEDHIIQVEIRVRKQRSS